MRTQRLFVWPKRKTPRQCVRYECGKLTMHEDRVCGHCRAEDKKRDDLWRTYRKEA